MPTAASSSRGDAAVVGQTVPSFIASPIRSLLLLNRSVSRSLLTLMHNSGRRSAARYHPRYLWTWTPQYQPRWYARYVFFFFFIHCLWDAHATIPTAMICAVRVCVCVCVWACVCVCVYPQCLWTPTPQYQPRWYARYIFLFFTFSLSLDANATILTAMICAVCVCVWACVCACACSRACACVCIHIYL